MEPNCDEAPSQMGALVPWTACELDRVDRAPADVKVSRPTYTHDVGWNMNAAMAFARELYNAGNEEAKDEVVRIACLGSEMEHEFQENLKRITERQEDVKRTKVLKKKKKKKAHRATATSDPKTSEARYKNLCMLLETCPPDFGSTWTYRACTEWAERIEIEFTRHNVPEVEDHRRSTWAIAGLKDPLLRSKAQYGRQLQWVRVREELGRYLSEPMVHRVRASKGLFGGPQGPGKTVQAVSQRLSDNERAIALGEMPEPWRTWFYFTKLPAGVQNKLIQEEYMMDCADTQQLLERARAIENLSK